MSSQTTWKEPELPDYKKDLADFRNGLLSLGLIEGDEPLELHATLEKQFFDCSVQIKELLQPHVLIHEPMPVPTSTPSDSKGVKLPKLDVPTKFSTESVFWSNSASQSIIAPSLSDSEKLVYLQHALKDGSAKHVIEGLSHLGEHYIEA